MQIKLKAGIPLVTKDGNRYGNAVVYKVFDNGERQRYHILTDFCNRLMFMSEEDVLLYWDISEDYINQVRLSEAFNITEAYVDSCFDLKTRLEYQLELINKAIEGLE